MPTYLVERVLPGATMEQVEELQVTLEHACSQAREHGSAITYLRSLFTPGESRCRSLFVAPSAEAVRELNDASGLSYSRIVVAVELVGEPEPRSTAETTALQQSRDTVDARQERSK